MIKTITGIYDSPGKVINAMDELLATGIDREKVYVDKENETQIKVMVPNTIDREITEILERHNPKEIFTKRLFTPPLTAMESEAKAVSP